MQTRLNKLVQDLVVISPLFFATYLIRFSVEGIPFTALEAFTYIVFLLWLLQLFSERKRLNWNRSTRHFWYAAFLVFTGATLGMLAAPNYIDLPSGEVLNAKRATMGIWKGWIVAPMLYFVMLTQVLTSQSLAKKVLRYFVYSAAIVCLVAFGWGLWAEGVTIDFRLRGFYESANYLALYIVPAILLNIYFALSRNPKETRQNLIDISTLTILIYSLLFTQSYAAIIGVFGALGLFALYYLFKNPKHRKKIIGALAALAFTFLIIILTQLNSPKFKQFLDLENRSSSTVRLEIYQTSLSMISENPALGVGPGLFQANYQNAAPRVLQRAPLEWNMPHSHNILLGFWLNAGFLGLVGFLALIVYAHRRFTYPLIALWATLLHGLFDMPFWKNDLAMIFWLLLAAILILQKHASYSTKV